MKKRIIDSFTKEDGDLCAVVATVAFSMGLDSPNIRKVLHWGSPADLEMNLQQSGCGGHDGEHCTAILYWSAKDLSSKDTITNEMKAYCSNNGECQ